MLSPSGLGIFYTLFYIIFMYCCHSFYIKREGTMPLRSTVPSLYSFLKHSLKLLTVFLKALFSCLSNFILTLFP